MTTSLWQMALSGDLKEFEDAAQSAVTGAIRSAVTRMKNQGRAQMRRAGLGNRLPNAFRGTVLGSDGRDITRRGIDPDPTGFVFSRPPKGAKVDLISVFEEGAVIQSKHGPCTAVPTKEAGGRRALSPTSYPRGTFAEVPASRKPGRLRRGGVRPVAYLIHRRLKQVWYILLPVFTLRKRLKLAELHARIAAGIPEDIDRRWARAVIRLGLV